VGMWWAAGMARAQAVLHPLSRQSGSNRRRPAARGLGAASARVCMWRRSRSHASGQPRLCCCWCLARARAENFGIGRTPSQCVTCVCPPQSFCFQQTRANLAPFFTWESPDAFAMKVKVKSWNAVAYWRKSASPSL
jgi:hypothetical protein